jgi:hypothetical protein
MGCYKVREKGEVTFAKDDIRMSGFDRELEDTDAFDLMRTEYDDRDTYSMYTIESDRPHDEQMCSTVGSSPKTLAFSVAS